MTLSLIHIYRSSADLAVCDVSFTSIATILPAVLELLTPNGAFLTLVKPQFEAPQSEVGEGGIVRDPTVHARVLADAVELFHENGLSPLGLCASPITLSLIHISSRYITCVEHIDLDALWASGKRAILLDRDNTLVPRDRTCAPESVAAWLDHAREPVSYTHLATWFIREARYLNNARMICHTSCAVSGSGYLVSAKLIEGMKGWDFHTCLLYTSRCV